MYVFEYHTQINSEILHRKITLKSLAGLSPSVCGFSKEVLRLLKKISMMHYKAQMFNVIYSVEQFYFNAWMKGQECNTTVGGTLVFSLAEKWTQAFLKKK